MLKLIFFVPLLLLGACAGVPSSPLPHSACLSVSGPASVLPQVCNPAIRG